MNAVGWLWVAVPCRLMKTALDKLWHIYTHHGATLLQNTGGFCQLSRHCKSNNVRILSVPWGLWMGKGSERNECVPFVCMHMSLCVHLSTFIKLVQEHECTFICKWGLQYEYVFMHGCIECMRGCVCVWGLLLAIQADRCQVVSAHRSSDQVETWRRKGESLGHTGATKLLGLV